VRSSDSKTEVPAVKQFYREVGIRIRQARKLSDNMTQEALAMSVGLTRTSLTNIEKGRQRMLLHTFTEIAAALGINPSQLLPGKENVLNGIGVKLPSSLAQDEREFVERAIGAGAPYETYQTKTNSREGKPTPSRKRNNQGSN